MQKEVIAIAFSDLHLNEWKQHSVKHSRLRNGIDVVRVLSKKAKKLNVPLLFSGDLIHNPLSVSNRVFSAFEKAYNEYLVGNKVNLFAIDGNHDQNEKNTYSNRTSGYIKSFSINKPYIQCLNFDFKIHNKVVYAGIPYLTHNEGFAKAEADLIKAIKKHNTRDYPKVLLIHTDLPGAKTPDGLELEEYFEIGKRIDKEFKFWNLVLSGHIHLPQVLAKKVVMLGSPQHQTASDAGIDMGYWEIYSDMTYKLIPLNQYPKFMYYDEGDTPPDLINFWIERPKRLVEEEIIDAFNPTMSKKKLAKRYCKATGQAKKSKINYLTKILNAAE